jgi:hypothetical protein
MTVSVRTVEPAPTAVVAATATWAEFPARWGPMLDKVWAFLRGEDAPAGLYQHGSGRLVRPVSQRVLDRLAGPEDAADGDGLDGLAGQIR